MTTASTARSGRGGRRATRPSGDEREAAILATAERLLEDKKFADISVDDLAKRRLSRPTFYFYFPSKDAVLLALIDPLIQRADTGFDGGATQHLPADPRRAFREGGIRTFFTAFGSHSVVARAGTEALASSPTSEPCGRRSCRSGSTRPPPLIEAERARGAAPTTIDAHDLATSLNMMNERTMTATLVAEPGSVAQDRVVDTLAHIWLTSIYGDNQ